MMPRPSGPFVFDQNYPNYDASSSWSYPHPSQWVAMLEEKVFSLSHQLKQAYMTSGLLTKVNRFIPISIDQQTIYQNKADGRFYEYVNRYMLDEATAASFPGDSDTLYPIIFNDQLFYKDSHALFEIYLLYENEDSYYGIYTRPISKIAVQKALVSQNISFKPELVSAIPDTKQATPESAVLMSSSKADAAPPKTYVTILQTQPTVVKPTAPLKKSMGFFVVENSPPLAEISQNSSEISPLKSTSITDDSKSDHTPSSETETKSETSFTKNLSPQMTSTTDENHNISLSDSLGSEEDDTQPEEEKILLLKKEKPQDTLDRAVRGYSLERVTKLCGQASEKDLQVALDYVEDKISLYVPPKSRRHAQDRAKIKENVAYTSIKKVLKKALNDLKPKAVLSAPEEKIVGQVVDETKSIVILEEKIKPASSHKKAKNHRKAKSETGIPRIPLAATLASSKENEETKQTSEADLIKELTSKEIDIQKIYDLMLLLGPDTTQETLTLLIEVVIKERNRHELNMHIYGCENALLNPVRADLEIEKDLEIQEAIRSGRIISIQEKARIMIENLYLSHGGKIKHNKNINHIISLYSSHLENKFKAEAEKLNLCRNIIKYLSIIEKDISDERHDKMVSIIFYIDRNKIELIREILNAKDHSFIDGLCEENKKLFLQLLQSLVSISSLRLLTAQDLLNKIEEILLRQRVGMNLDSFLKTQELLSLINYMYGEDANITSGEQAKKYLEDILKPHKENITFYKGIMKAVDSKNYTGFCKPDEDGEAKHKKEEEKKLQTLIILIASYRLEIFQIKDLINIANIIGDTKEIGSILEAHDFDQMTNLKNKEDILNRNMQSLSKQVSVYSRDLFDRAFASVSASSMSAAVVNCNIDSLNNILITKDPTLDEIDFLMRQAGKIKKYYEAAFYGYKEIIFQVNFELEEAKLLNNKIGRQKDRLGHVVNCKKILSRCIESFSLNIELEVGESFMSKGSSSLNNIVTGLQRRMLMAKQRSDVTNSMIDILTRYQVLLERMSKSDASSPKSAVAFFPVESKKGHSSSLAAERSIKYKS